MESPPGAETVIDGRRYLYFGGTSYLGLAGHPEVIEAACEAVRRYGLHTATSRTGFGHSPPLLEVERRAAEFFDAEAAFYFPSGYAGTHILVQTLSPSGSSTLVLIDEAAHYCGQEAAGLGGRTVVSFRHRDPANLASVLRQRVRAEQSVLVMADGVSPVTGKVAPLADYLSVLEAYPRAGLIVDDAHGLGVLGENGQGTLEGLGWGAGRVNAPSTSAGPHLFRCGTLSKAMGGYGGIIAGKRPFVQRLQAATHYYEGASAPPAPVAAASAKALEIVTREPELRRRLGRNGARLRQGLRALGLPVEEAPTANLGLAIGTAADMQSLHGALKQAGLLVPYLGAYPGVGPEGMLRFAVCALHTPAMIDHLVAVLRRIL